MPVDTVVGPVQPVIPEMGRSVQVDTLINILIYMKYAHLFFPLAGWVLYFDMTCADSGGSELRQHTTLFSSSL